MVASGTTGTTFTNSHMAISKSSTGSIGSTGTTDTTGTTFTNCHMRISKSSTGSAARYQNANFKIKSCLKFFYIFKGGPD